MRLKHFFMLTSISLLIVAMLGVGSSGSASAKTTADDGGPPTSGRVACKPARGETVTIATAKLIIEYNSTDNDIGVHGAFDDRGWSELCVYDPNGKQVLAVKPQAQLKDLTMGAIFFESREPPGAEFSFEDLKAKFPEGQYQVRGITFDGKRLTGSATFTHNVPAPPTVISPLEGDVVSLTDLVIKWEDVTETIDGEPITITGYEVIIVKIDHNDPHGFSRPIFDVHVPPDRNALAVPVEFLEPGTEYELEVLALEESGNQTITVSSFTTE
ncbi:MAG: fibronectin type III domain-containing protein [Anaerolineae bacterium]|nr:fibronectin type III domain-containing protein [Anaerolineae bacterium]